MISNSYFNKSELTVTLLEPSLIVNVRSPTFDLYRRAKVYFILFQTDMLVSYLLN